nr:hypothetical protein GTC16762_32990 [Pigmentibacter ruber]
MKRCLIVSFLLSPSILFASYKIDFNLYPHEKGGNSDASTFSSSKLINFPKNYIGKTITAPILYCFTSELKGKDLNNKEVLFDGVRCASGDISVGVIMDLKDRELAKNDKYRNVTGKIVATDPGGFNILIIKPEILK